MVDVIVGSDGSVRDGRLVYVRAVGVVVFAHLDAVMNSREKHSRVEEYLRN